MCPKLICNILQVYELKIYIVCFEKWYICMGTMCLCVHIMIFNALNFPGKAGLFMPSFSSLDSDIKNYHILVPVSITANSAPWRYYDK